MDGTHMSVNLMTGSVSEIIKRLAAAVNGIAQARHLFGVAIVTLIEVHGYSRDAAAKRIIEALPDYQVRTGHKLTATWLLASADRVLSHRAIGGIPDGKGNYVVPERDFVNSPMPDALAKRVANLTASNPAKGSQVLRGSDVAQAVAAMATAKDDDSLAKAINTLEAKVSKVENARRMADKGERGILELAVSDARAKLASAEAAVARAQSKLKAAKDALAAFDAAVAASEATAEDLAKVETGAKVKPRRSSPRITSAAQVATGIAS